MIAIDVAPLVELVKLFYDPLAKRIRYVKDIHYNSGILEDMRDDLERKISDLKREVQRAAETGKIPTDEVKAWLEKAGTLEDSAQWLIQEAHLIQQGCFSTWFLNCCSSYKLGKKISRTKDWANDLLNRSFVTIMVDPLPEKVLLFPTREIKENTSAAAKMEQIMRLLSNDQTGKVGLWGNRGIGKSTILKNIYNKFGGTSDFDAIIMVEFNKNGRSKKLRQDIIAELSLDTLKEENETRLCRLLYQELKKKTFLLIVDNLSEVVDLEEIGIPDTSQQKHCKIVISSMKREICSRMAVDEEIELDPLSEEEAWELFLETVGTIPPEIDQIARLVCHKCRRIAAILVTLGNALRNQEFHTWERALSILQSEPRLTNPEELVEAITKKPSNCKFDKLRNKKKAQHRRTRVNPNNPNDDDASEMYAGSGSVTLYLPNSSQYYGDTEEEVPTQGHATLGEHALSIRPARDLLLLNRVGGCFGINSCIHCRRAR